MFLDRSRSRISVLFSTAFYRVRYSMSVVSVQLYMTFRAHKCQDVMREVQAAVRNSINNAVTEKGWDIRHMCR